MAIVGLLDLLSLLAIGRKQLLPLGTGKRDKLNRLAIRNLAKLLQSLIHRVAVEHRKFSRTHRRFTSFLEASSDLTIAASFYHHLLFQ